MKKSKRRIIALISIFAILMTLLPNTIVMATVSSEVDIEVDQDDLLDIVLTLGKTDTNVSTLQADLTAALVAKGVPLDKIKIQAVESSEVAAGNTSSGWEVYDHTNNASTEIPYYRPYYNETNGNYSLDNHLVVSTGTQTNIDFYGYGAPAYKDFMYMPNTDFGKKTIDFTIQEGSFFDALNGAGFLFNTSMSSNTALDTRTMSGYLLFFWYPYGQNPTAYIYKFTNVDVNAFHNSAYTAIQDYAGFEALAYFAVGAETTRVVKIEAAADTLDMTYNGSPVTWTLTSDSSTTQTVALPTDFGAYGFGPLVGYTSHGCSLNTHFTFLDVKMSMESSKRFSEVIRGPEWRANSKRFIINAEDGAVADFSDPVALGEILTRLGNEGIDYLGWGKNAADGIAFITKNDGNGTFVDKTQAATDTYAEQINALANYIYSQYHSSAVNDTEWLIYGNPSSLAITPQSEKTDTADADWPDGKWRINHDENYFENSTGTALYDNLYLSNLDISFVEAGKYDIYYKDVLTKTVYVHRRPIAGFGVSMSGSDVTLVDNAYDPDHQSAVGKGIASTAWAYRETSADTWIDGQPATFADNKEYIIRQTVVDVEGVSGNPYYRYVSTSSDAAAQPVAEFNITPGRLLTYQTEDISYMDTSYDPQGAAITARLWTITRDGTAIYSGASPKTNFAGLSAGTYKIALKVKNNSNIWSEEVARFMVLVRDTTDPVIACDTAANSYSTQKNITVTVADENGGSGFSSRYAVVNHTADAPSSWGSIGTNAVLNVALLNTGTWYIHVKAADYAGNETISNFGPFVLADTHGPSAPVITPTPAYTSATWATTAINLTASGSVDDFTAAEDIVYYYSLDGAPYVEGTSVDMTDNGTYTVTFKTADELAQESSIVTWTVKIDKTLPTITPSYDASNIGTKLDLSIAAGDSESGLASVSTCVGNDSWTTIDLSSGEPLNAYTVDLSFFDNELTSDRYVVRIEIVDRAGNIKQKIIYLLPEFVKEKIKSLPDPETATDEEITDAQEEVRDTKRLLDLLTEEQKDDLPDSDLSKLDKVLSRMDQLLVIVSEDAGTGIEADGIGTSTNIPELSDESVTMVNISLQTDPYNASNTPNFVISAEEELAADQVEILQAFDIFLLKTVVTNEGQTSGKVGNEDITGFITIRLPLPDAFTGRLNLCVAYIADDGTVTKLETKLVIIDGKKYLEFQTDHFSTYAILGDEQIPTTGESGIGLAGLLVFAAAAALLFLRRKMRRERQEEI